MEYDLKIEDKDIEIIISYTRNSSVAPGVYPQIYDYLVSKKYTKEQVKSFENHQSSSGEQMAYAKYCKACESEAKSLLGLDK